MQSDHRGFDVIPKSTLPAESKSAYRTRRRGALWRNESGERATIRGRRLTSCGDGAKVLGTATCTETRARSMPCSGPRTSGHGGGGGAGSPPFGGGVSRDRRPRLGATAVSTCRDCCLGLAIRRHRGGVLLGPPLRAPHHLQSDRESDKRQHGFDIHPYRPLA